MARKFSKKNNFIQFSCANFLKELGSDSASPGGGAAAALTGAIGVSLIEMVSRINEKRAQRKIGQKTSSSLFKTQIASLTKIRTRFGMLMKLDVEAFLKLSKFSNEKRSGAAYEKALKAAAAVPLEMANCATQAMLIGESEIKRTSRWLASDLAEAGILLEASFHSARLNVEINMGLMKDIASLSKIKAALSDFERKVGASKANLLKDLPSG